MLNDIKEENSRRSSIKQDLRHKFVDPLQIFEYCKDVVDRVFAAIVQSADRFPPIIKIYCALVRKYLQKYLDMSVQKNQDLVQGIVVEMVYSKWLFYPLFLQPTFYGIIRNNDVNEIHYILLEFSKLIKLILKHKKLAGASMYSWTALFTEFVDERFEEGQQFADTILGFEAPEVGPIENSTNSNKVSKIPFNSIGKNRLHVMNIGRSDTQNM